MPSRFANKQPVGRMPPTGADQLDEPGVKNLLIAVLQEEKKISYLLEAMVHCIRSPHHQPFVGSMIAQRNFRDMMPMSSQGNANALRARMQAEAFNPVVQKLAEAQMCLANQIAVLVGRMDRDKPAPNATQGEPRTPASDVVFLDDDSSHDTSAQVPGRKDAGNGPASTPTQDVAMTNSTETIYSKANSDNFPFEKKKSQDVTHSRNPSATDRDVLDEFIQPLDQSESDDATATESTNTNHSQNAAEGDVITDLNQVLANSSQFPAALKKKIHALLMTQHEKISPEEVSKLISAHSESKPEDVQEISEADTVAALLNLSGRKSPHTKKIKTEEDDSQAAALTRPPPSPSQPQPLNPSRSALSQPNVNKKVAVKLEDDGEASLAAQEDSLVNTYAFREGTLLRTFLKPTDTHLVTQFTYYVLAELEVAYFTWRDRRGNRRKLITGYPGMACRYCHGDTGRTGRYFPSSVKTMADSKKTLFSVYDHLSCCQKTPDEVKRRLLTLYGQHVAEQGKKVKRHGSQRDFFRRVFNMLHSKKEGKE
jgi:hypothetical protein